MMIFVIAWLISGFSYWLSNMGEMGFVGDFLIGLPMCLIFGPIWIFNTWFTQK